MYRWVLVAVCLVFASPVFGATLLVINSKTANKTQEIGDVVEIRPDKKGYTKTEAQKFDIVELPGWTPEQVQKVLPAMLLNKKFRYSVKDVTAQDLGTLLEVSP